MSFTALHQLIPKSANKLQLGGDLQASMILHRAATILKMLFPRHEMIAQMRVTKFVKGTLWIAVDHPIVAQEIQLKSRKVLELLNGSLEESIVKEIRSFQESKDVEEDYDSETPIWDEE